MPATMRQSLASSHPVIPEMRPRMAKADLRKPENWKLIGEVVDRTRTLCRLSIKEFADKLERDERQVRAWISGEEQTQIAVIFGVLDFRKPFVIALAEQAGTGVEIETIVRVKSA